MPFGPDESVWVVVVAGGEGRRFGGHKQFAELAGRRVLDWAVSAAAQVADGVVVVLPPSMLADDAARPAALLSGPGAPITVAGGPTRSASVRAGLAAVPNEAAYVIVHDAARPFASVALFEAVLAAVRNGSDGAVCGLPVTDTIKRRRPDGGLETLDRSELVAVQTPQAFRAEALREAHRDAHDATDDAALVEAIGGLVVFVLGEATNAKLTAPEDLAAFEGRAERLGVHVAADDDGDRS